MSMAGPSPGALEALRVGEPAKDFALETVGNESGSRSKHSPARFEPRIALAARPARATTSYRRLRAHGTTRQPARCSSLASSGGDHFALKLLRVSPLATARYCSCCRLVVASVEALSTENSAVRVGDRAPGFTLRSFRGKNVQLSDHLGKAPILLVFWSFFWCPCCSSFPAPRRESSRTAARAHSASAGGR
jgi:hypothetical protein